jgi:hypothetical protein
LSGGSDRTAWSGIDIETALPLGHLLNMAQRAAAKSTGDAVHGQQRIVSVQSNDRVIKFRINGFLVSFTKLMVFTLAFNPSGNRFPRSRLWL